ncbi:hypothetical protein LVJ94_39890 [Pendulispora rubella]|uniref:Cytochrome c domain-containing protein n=1 Tax=Pendulispora rubella TaxID=2741070 RepID=A0ABZ2L339_9BACT
MRRALLVALPLLAGCATAAIQDRSVSAVDRAPRVLQRVPLPAGARAVGVVAQEGGEGIIELADGHFLRVDVRGEVQPIDGAPALPRAEWTTSGGLRAEYGGRWFALEAPPGNELGVAPEGLRSIAQVVPLTFRGAKDAKGARDAWIRIGTSVVRVHLEGGADAPKVTWMDPAPGASVGAVQSIARIDEGRGAMASDRGLTLVSEGTIRTYRDAGIPGPLGGGGGWAWVGWNGQILRTDGETWESLAKDVVLGQGARLAVDGGTGTFALVLDGAGGVWRIQADGALFLSGLANGAAVFDTKLELEASPAERDALERVSFALDGKDVASRTAPPWGWGTDGVRPADLASIGFGTHRIDVRARFGDGRERTRTLRFDYRSPIGRIPTYDADIAPLYDAKCGSCHTAGVGRGVARDLSSYERLSGQAAAVRRAVRQGRMPPDLRLDPVSTSLFTAWIDGRTPR